MSSQVTTPKYSLERLDVDDWQDIEKFYKANDHKFVDVRNAEDYREAALADKIYVIKNHEGDICASVIAWEYQSGRYIEIGSGRNTGPYGYNFAEILAACIIADYAMDDSFGESLAENTAQVFSGVYRGNKTAIHILTNDKLRFIESPTPSKAFKDARNKTLANPEGANNLEYYEFSPKNIGRIFKYISEIRAQPFRYNIDGEAIYLDIKRWDTKSGQAPIASPQRLRA